MEVFPHDVELSCAAAGALTCTVVEPVAIGCSDDMLDREVRRDGWEHVHRMRRDLLVMSPPA